MPTPKNKPSPKQTAPELAELGKPAPTPALTPPRLTPRELADRAALRVLRLRGVCLATIKQAHAIGTHDDHADGAGWAYSEAIDAIALERHATREEDRAAVVADAYEIVASGPRAHATTKKARKGGRR